MNFMSSYYMKEEEKKNKREKKRNFCEKLKKKKKRCHDIFWGGKKIQRLPIFNPCFNDRMNNFNDLVSIPRIISL